DAELLSASSRPNGLPSRCACCVALTPLSKRHFFEVISCAVKGRTPLRTARASFPACRSSLLNARGRARLCSVQRLAMDLPMTGGMQEHPVVCCITASVGPPDDVMVVPARQSGHLLMTDRAKTLLVFPEVQQLPSAFQVVCHLHAYAC